MQSFSFGVFADVQFSHRDMAINRYYRQAAEKVRRYLKIFQQHHTDFLIHLGDLIDDPEDEAAGFLCAQEMTQLIQSSAVPCCYVIGNHDTGSVPLDRLSALWGWPSDRAYGSFDFGNLHFIVLDTNYDRNGHHYCPQTHDWTHSYVSEAQLRWLKLDLVQTKQPRIIVLSHALLDDFDNPHVVRNAALVRDILENCGKPVVVLQGHMHCGHCSTSRGISYHTLSATVEGKDSFCFWIVSVDSDETVSAQIYTDKGIRSISLF